MKKLCSAALLMSAVATMGCSELGIGGEDVFSLKVGSCFNDPGGLEANAEEVSSVPMRECNEPHDNEAFYTYNLPDGPTLPESAEIEQEIYVRCEQAFEEYLGISYNESYYEYSVYSPSHESWSDGDREILCFAYDPEGKELTQSVKGIQK